MIINHVPRLLAEKFGGKENINLTQIQMDTGIAYSSVSAWAKGRVDRFDLNIMEKWCDYLNVDPGQLFTREKPQSSKE
jgi:DNA-binding Xre family transcriptional regulator